MNWSESWPIIRVERCGHNWLAFFGDDPRLSGMGRTEAAAIGALIAEYGPFHIDVQADVNPKLEFPRWACVLLAILIGSAMAGLVAR